GGRSGGEGGRREKEKRGGRRRTARRLVRGGGGRVRGAEYNTPPHSPPPRHNCRPRASGDPSPPPLEYGSPLSRGRRQAVNAKIGKPSAAIADQNFTCGACSSTLRSSTPTSKKSFGVNPSAPASSTAGDWWMPVVYSCTALLKKRRAAAILFSMSESWACNCWKFWLALRSG